MNINFIEHNNISEEDIQKICILKKQHWDYSLEEQTRWINNNLTNNDVHLLIRDNICMSTSASDEVIIGYMNLVNLEIKLYDKTVRMIGIGNVCIEKSCQRNYYGFLLMKLAEYYLQKNKTNGILLCKEKLIPFYDLIRWNRYNGITKIDKRIFNGIVYVYNIITSDEIIINKSF